jgi:hypothetical protein
LLLAGTLFSTLSCPLGAHENQLVLSDVQMDNVTAGIVEADESVRLLAEYVEYTAYNGGHVNFEAAWVFVQDERLLVRDRGQITGQRQEAIQEDRVSDAAEIVMELASVGQLLRASRQLLQNMGAVASPRRGTQQFADPRAEVGRSQNDASAPDDVLGEVRYAAGAVLLSVADAFGAVEGLVRSKIKDAVLQSGSGATMTALTRLRPPHQQEVPGSGSSGRQHQVPARGVSSSRSR